MNLPTYQELLADIRVVRNDLKRVDVIARAIKYDVVKFRNEVAALAAWNDHLTAMGK